MKLGKYLNSDCSRNQEGGGLKLKKNKSENEVDADNTSKLPPNPTKIFHPGITQM
jgi:hypothetical protein